MRYSRFALLVLLAMTAFAGRWNAQNKVAGSEERGAKAVLSNASGTATIETTVDAQPVGGRPVSFRLYEKNGKVSKRLVRDDAVPDCVRPMIADEVCKTSADGGGVKFVYSFSSAPKPDSSFEVFFDISDVRRGDIAQVVKVVVADDGSSMAKLCKVSITQPKANEIEISIQSPLASQSAVTDEEGRLIVKHLESLYAWFEARKGTTEDVSVLVEVRNPKVPHSKQGGTPKTPVTSGTPIPGAAKDVPIPQPEAFAVKKLWLDPPPGAPNTGVVDLFIEMDKKFPTGKYDLQITFPDGSPAELVSIVKSMTGSTMMGTPDASKVDKTLALRDPKNNLDLAVSDTSSVVGVKVGKNTIRQRQNNGTFDIRFAPWINKSFHQDRFFWTPIFVDAKISNGDLNTKTLSTNRILFGSKLAIDARPRSSDDAYHFAFSLVNASDRDFKRAEATFAVDFTPVLAALNRPLERQKRYFESILIKTQEMKEVTTGWFGYQIQPLIGTEVGRVYRAERGAFDGEERDPTVRRLKFGTDIVLNLTAHANLKVTDTFYLRGEDKLARTRNYFKSEVQAPVFASGNTSQCLFFSFEKGDQPPFTTPTVNTFTIGYRIMSNFIRRDR